MLLIQVASQTQILRSYAPLWMVNFGIANIIFKKPNGAGFVV